MLTTKTNTLADKFWDLEADLRTVVFERFNEIHGASLALITKEHHFTLGVPGGAKTMMVDELVKRIEGMGGEDYFSILLMKSTPAEELFGVYDMPLLMESIYKRQTRGMLPNAKIAALDEIFKGSAATLNALLWLLNERWFNNYGEDKVRPLMTAFTMSNELAESEGLSALWDRLMFRYQTDSIQDTSNLMKMLTSTPNPSPEKFITLEDIEEAGRQASLVVITDDILKGIKDVKDQLQEKGITVTDRRWKKSIKAIKAEAWMLGHDEAEIGDLAPLAHILWNDVNEIQPVQAVIRELADPQEAQAMKLFEDLTATFTTYKEQRDGAEDRHTKTKAGLRMFQKWEAADKEFGLLQDKVDTRRSDVMVRLRKQIDRVNDELSANLQIDADREK